MKLYLLLGTITLSLVDTFKLEVIFEVCVDGTTAGSFFSVPSLVRGGGGGGDKGLYIYIYICVCVCVLVHIFA